MLALKGMKVTSCDILIIIKNIRMGKSLLICILCGGNMQFRNPDPVLLVCELSLGKPY